MADEYYKSLDDIVFEKRNQEYGAYDLRKSQPKILTKSFIIGVGIILLTTLGIVLYNTVFTRADKEETFVDVTLTDVDIPDVPEEEEQKPEEPEPEPEPEIAEVRVVVPEPKKDVVKEEPMASIDEMKDKVIGTENKEGDASSGIKGKSEPTGSGEGTKPAPPPPPPPPQNFTARQVKDMAIYPGCEKFKGDKNKLQSCMQQKLTLELNDQLSDFAQVMADNGDAKAVTRVQFVIDKTGKIIQIKAMEGGGPAINKKLATESEKAMQRISQRLSARGKPIEPAKLDDGSSVNLVFVLPVTYNLE